MKNLRLALGLSLCAVSALAFVACGGKDAAAPGPHGPHGHSHEGKGDHAHEHEHSGDHAGHHHDGGADGGPHMHGHKH